MKTKTIIEKNSGSDRLFNTPCFELCEVVYTGSVSTVLRVGDVVFRTPGYIYVIGAQQGDVARYDWNTPILQGIRVRKFQGGESFTIEFQD